MSPENEIEFQELSAYVGFFATAVWGVPESAPQHPSHNLEVIPGKVSKSQRLAGLRQAARDTVEASQDLSAEQVAVIDSACKQRQIVTLSEIRTRYSNGV